MKRKKYPGYAGMANEFCNFPKLDPFADDLEKLKEEYYKLKAEEAILDSDEVKKRTKIILQRNPRVLESINEILEEHLPHWVGDDFRTQWFIHICCWSEEHIDFVGLESDQREAIRELEFRYKYYMPDECKNVVDELKRLAWRPREIWIRLEHIHDRLIALGDNVFYSPDELELEIRLTPTQRKYWNKLPSSFQFNEVAGHIVPRSTLHHLTKRTESLGLLKKDEPSGKWLKA